MKNLWLLLCSRAIVDRSTNQITLVDILDSVTLTQPPGSENDLESLGASGGIALPVQFHAVSYWTRSNPQRSESADVRTLIRAPNGKSIAFLDRTVELEEHVNRRLIVRFSDFPFVGFGVYRIVVSLRGESGRWKKVNETLFSIYAGSN